MRTVLTTCPFCACGCGLYLQAHDGKLVGVMSAEHHPVSRGRLCARGWSAHEAPSWGKRLTRPLIRRNGGLLPVSWSEALSEARRLLTELVTGGEAVGVLCSARATNEESFLLAKLARTALSTDHLELSAEASNRPLLAGLAGVLGGVAPLKPVVDIEESETVVLLEGDLAQTHPRLASAVMTAVRRGAALITLGPRRTRMSRLASLHLGWRPGAEDRVLNGLLAAAVELVGEAGESIDDELVEATRGVPFSEEMRTAASWIASASRVVFLCTPELARSADDRIGMSNAAALASLAAITGHVVRPGSGLLALVARSNFVGAWEMGTTTHPPPWRATVAVGPGPRGSRQGAANRRGANPGLDAEAMLGRVRGLVVLADDPPSTLLDERRTRAAMEAMACVVALDAFTTPTTEAAHVVLPIAAFGETEGTITNLEGRAQRVRAAVDPPGESRPGWRVLSDLLAQFGAGEGLPSLEAIHDEIAATVPSCKGLEPGALHAGGGAQITPVSSGSAATLGVAEAGEVTSEAYPLALAVDGTVDWGCDPLVRYSPTLRRDEVSRRKLFPQGLVEMAKARADALGVRAGWRVKVISSHGEAVLVVAIAPGLDRDVLLVPFAFREQASPVLAGKALAAVRIEPV